MERREVQSNMGNIAGSFLPTQQAAHLQRTLSHNLQGLEAC